MWSPTSTSAPQAAGQRRSRASTTHSELSDPRSTWPCRGRNGLRRWTSGGPVPVVAAGLGVLFVDVGGAELAVGTLVVEAPRCLRFFFVLGLAVDAQTGERQRGQSTG